MDKNAGVRQRKSLSRGPGTQQKGSHRRTLADADRRNVVLDELHRVVDRHSGGYRTARAVDVQVDVAFRVLGLEKQELRDDKICDLIVDRCADKNDTVLQKAGVNVECPLASRSLFDNHRY